MHWYKLRILWTNEVEKACFIPSVRGIGQLRWRQQETATHQSLVSEGVVYAPDEEPEGPQVLKPELQHKVCQQHQRPHHQELQVQEGTREKAGIKMRGIHTLWFFWSTNTQQPTQSSLLPLDWEWDLPFTISHL